MANLEKIITPKCVLEWVTIDGEGKENLSGKMQYVANAVFDPQTEEGQKVVAQINAFWEANKPKGFKKKAKSNGLYFHDLVKDSEGNPVLDEDGNKTYDKDGKMYLAFKTGTSFPDGSQKVVKVYNAKNKLVTLGDTKIGNGSVGRVQGMIGLYMNKSKTGTVLDAGVTLYLDAIQISKLEEYSGDDAGFDVDDEADAWTGEDDTFEGEAPETTKTQPRL